jgi:hypothetical protein
MRFSCRSSASGAGEFLHIDILVEALTRPWGRLLPRTEAFYSSNRSLVPAGFSGAIEASGICAALPWSRNRLTIG